MFINGIDELDNKILALLQKDGRMSCSDIGEKVGLSRTAVRNRINALEQSGIIKGYTAIVDPLASPKMLSFVSRIVTEPSAYDEVTQRLMEEKCVLTLCQISGECELHAICVAEDLNEMRDFARRIRSSNPKILRFSAHMVYEVMKGSVLPD